MINCRFVAPETWEHARQALVFYFTRRHGVSRAEDLAQETLTTILVRDDYLFEKEEDFLKVCYGFAYRVLQNARREASKESGLTIDDAVPAQCAEAQGLKDAEIRVFLKEVLRVGEQQLREKDWKLIQQSSDPNRGLAAGIEDPAEANRTRVKLHRARRKLALLAGWRKG
jgi:DNA-directed RNA polymerase specialized sigma24 family protein